MQNLASEAIVNVAAIAAFHYTAPYVPYAGAKVGISALTRNLVYEGIRPNAVAPGANETPMMDNALTEEQKAANAKTVRVGRIEHPLDIGNAAVFPASDAAGYHPRHPVARCRNRP